MAIPTCLPLRFFLVLVFSLLVSRCKNKPSGEKLFQELSPEETGLEFENKVIQNGENNVLNYSYYFNGGGVAVGDINNEAIRFPTNCI